jgi:hypothetical protein
MSESPKKGLTQVINTEDTPTLINRTALNVNSNNLTNIDGISINGGKNGNGNT